MGCIRWKSTFKVLQTNEQHGGSKKRLDESWQSPLVETWITSWGESWGQWHKAWNSHKLVCTWTITSFKKMDFEVTRWGGSLAAACFYGAKSFKK